MKRIVYILFLIFAFLFITYVIGGKRQTVITNKIVTSKLDSIQNNLVTKKKFDEIKGSTTLTVNGIPVDIIQNDSLFIGDILVLPGWNFNRNIWCDSTDFCNLAKQKGYRLVLPEMGKSVYSSNFYPETRKDWIKYPNLTWVTDSLIPVLQKKYGIFISKQNYLLGLSTGARGVILVGIRTDTLFKKAAVLSGDYDQTKMTNDNLIKGYYGLYSKFKSRWAQIDNPVHDCNKINFNLFIGHGKKDKVVPYSQSIELFDSIRKHNRGKNVTISISEQHGHNFSYWRSETKNILDFFDSND